MEMKRLSAAIASTAMLWAVPVVAHHSFAAEYDRSKPITLHGKLVKVEWVNPHGWFHVDVADPDTKEVVTWAVESGSTNQLIRSGLRKTDFPVGSDLVIEGFRAKNGTPTINGTSVKFSDGRNFFLGATRPGAPK